MEDEYLNFPEPELYPGNVSLDSINTAHSLDYTAFDRHPLGSGPWAATELEDAYLGRMALSAKHVHGVSSLDLLLLETGILFGFSHMWGFRFVLPSGRDLHVSADEGDVEQQLRNFLTAEGVHIGH